MESGRLKVEEFETKRIGVISRMVLSEADGIVTGELELEAIGEDDVGLNGVFILGERDSVMEIGGVEGLGSED